MKPPEEHTRGSFQDIGMCRVFFVRFCFKKMPKAQETRKNRQLGLHYTENVLNSKGNNQERPPTLARNSFQMTLPTRVSYPEYMKFQKLNNKIIIMIY